MKEKIVYTAPTDRYSVHLAAGTPLGTFKCLDDAVRRADGARNGAYVVDRKPEE